MSFVEEFDCGSCESEDVFSISSSEFTTVNDFSGPWGWMPQFDIIEKVCPHCGAKTSFSMDVETTRGRDWLFIFEVE